MPYFIDSMSRKIHSFPAKTNIRNINFSRDLEKILGQKVTGPKILDRKIFWRTWEKIWLAVKKRVENISKKASEKFGKFRIF